MWPVNGTQHDDFLNPPRSGKLPDFQRIASGCFSSQPKNTHYASNFTQVRNFNTLIFNSLLNMEVHFSSCRMIGLHNTYHHHWHPRQLHRRLRMAMKCRNIYHHFHQWHNKPVLVPVVIIYPHHNPYQLVSTHDQFFFFFFLKCSQSQKYFVLDWVITTWMVGMGGEHRDRAMIQKENKIGHTTKSWWWAMIIFWKIRILSRLTLLFKIKWRFQWQSWPLMHVLLHMHESVLINFFSRFIKLYNF